MYFMYGLQFYYKSLLNSIIRSIIIVNTFLRGKFCYVERKKFDYLKVNLYSSDILKKQSCYDIKTCKHIWFLLKKIHKSNEVNDNTI